MALRGDLVTAISDPTRRSVSPKATEFGIAQVGWCIDVPAVHDRMRRRIHVLTEMHRDTLQASCVELHDSAGRKECRCCPATGLDGDEHDGSLVYVNNESRIRRNHRAMQFVIKDVGPEHNSNRVRRTLFIRDLSLL
jgi:hypothetical protein